MARFLKKIKKDKGLPPGTLVFIGEQKMEQSLIRLINYSPENIVETEIQNVTDIERFKKKSSVSWLNIDGVHNVELIQNIGDLFGLSPLLLEDIMNTGQRPKILDYENCSFITVKMLRFEENSGKILSEQLSLVIGEDFLLTFQEQKGDVFEPVRDRIRQCRKRITGSGPDFLCYALLDVVCENYLHIIEILGEKIDDLEEELLNNPKKDTMKLISRYKQEINYLRKSIRPVREVVNHIFKSENQIIKAPTLIYFRELFELTIQSNEAIDSYRELLVDQLNLYHTTMSTKMNDIMKVLTIFSAIFIPLTFIAGIYGTNFEVLPELRYEYSYFIMLGCMFIVALAMLYFFRNKKWL